MINSDIVRPPSPPIPTVSVSSSIPSTGSESVDNEMNAIGGAVLFPTTSSADPVSHRAESPLPQRNRWLNLTFYLSMISLAIGGGLYFRSNKTEDRRRLGQITVILGGITLLVGALSIQRACQAVIPSPPSSPPNLPIEDPMVEVTNEIETLLERLGPRVNNENNRLILTRRTLNVHHNNTEPEIKDRVILNILNHFTINMNTIARRIEHDSQWISEHFFEGCPIQLQSIQMTSAETHHRGQVPCILTFFVTKGDGTIEEKKIVYKPRDIRPDALICSKLPVELSSSASSSSSSSSSSSGTSSPPQMLSLFSTIANAAGYEMPTYLFLPMRDQETHAHYGYVEFLTHEEKDYRLEGEEIRNYFRMIGRIQALGQIFGIYDLHNANVHSHGKLPHPTDLETSFDPIRTHDDTALHLAVTDFEGDGFPTQNRVTLVDSEGQEYAHPLISPFREEVLTSIEDGFNDICRLCKEHEELRSQLMEFLDRLPEDLTVRFVPIGTTVLTGWLERISPYDPRVFSTDYSEEGRMRGRTPNVMTIHRAAHYLLYLTFLFDQLKLNDPDRMRREFPDEINAKIYCHLVSEIQQLSDDFLCHDIPAMTLSLREGLITHNALKIKLYQESLIDIIKERIVNPPPMFEYFRKELVNFKEEE